MAQEQTKKQGGKKNLEKDTNIHGDTASNKGAILNLWKKKKMN